MAFTRIKEHEVEERLAPLRAEDGTWILNKQYTEILKLSDMLEERGIPHSLDRCYDGWMLRYPERQHYCIDAVEHFASRGHELDTMESLVGLKKERYVGVLVGYRTAEQIYSEIVADFEEKQRQRAELRRRIRRGK